MLSKSTIEDLRRELRELRVRAAAIEAIIAGARGVSNDGTGPVVPEQVPKIPEILIENGTFSGIVRSALRAIGRTTTSKAVAGWIEKNVSDPKTGRPLRGAVAVELFRMAKKHTGGVNKVARGRYRIDPE